MIRKIALLGALTLSMTTVSLTMGSDVLFTPQKQKTVRPVYNGDQAGYDGDEEGSDDEDTDSRED